MSGAFRNALAAVIFIFVPSMAIPQASEPPLIAPDDGPWELNGGFKFKKNEDKTRRAMSGVACPSNSFGQRRCLAVFDEGGEARYLTTTLDIRSRQNRLQRPGGPSRPGQGRFASLLRADVMAIRLTYGNVGSIPTTAEVQNMQRYQEVLWLWTQS